MVRQVSPQGLEWFQNARFGLFIHWGLYALLGKQEWVLHIDHIPVDAYRLLANQIGRSLRPL